MKFIGPTKVLHYDLIFKMHKLLIKYLEGTRKEIYSKYKFNILVFILSKFCYCNDFSCDSTEWQLDSHTCIPVKAMHITH